MNKLALIAAAALTATTFGAAAIAQDATQSETGNFDSVDANADGFVSWDEALGAYPTLTQELFNQADGNADGNLDEAEFTALEGLSASVDDTTTAPTQTLPAETVSSESSSSAQ
jgi:hypothetical protein